MRLCKDTIQRLDFKVVHDLPWVEGFVIDVSGDQLTLDIDSSNGIKEGMKRVVYKEAQKNFGKTD